MLPGFITVFIILQFFHLSQSWLLNKCTHTMCVHASAHGYNTCLRRHGDRSLGWAWGVWWKQDTLIQNTDEMWCRFFWCGSVYYIRHACIKLHTYTTSISCHDLFSLAFITNILWYEVHCVIWMPGEVVYYTGIAERERRQLYSLYSL